MLGVAIGRNTMTDSYTDPLLVSIPGAAAALCVSEAMIWRLIRTDRLPHVRLGGRTLIATETLRKIARGELVIRGDK